MLKKYQKFAPIGLGISLVAAATALILRISAGQFTLAVQICIAVAVLGLAIFVILDPQSILQVFKGRQAKYGGNALVLTLAVIGILVIVNLFVYNHDVSWDLTEDKVNTLSPETLDILQNLELPVYAQAFFSSNISLDTAETLLSNFKRNANGMFDYEFIDPYQDPVTANQASITRDGTIVLSVDDQTDLIASVTEENLLNGIIKLQNPETTTVYVLTGHGEEDFFTSGDYSMTNLEQALEAKNYIVNTLNLVATPSIPEDAGAIIIAAPQIPLGQDEVDLIAAYLDQGGSLVLFSEPPFLTQGESDQADPLWTYLQTNWGLTLGNNMIIDLSIDPAEVAIADQYGDHTITDAMEGYITFYPTAHSVQSSAISGITTTELVLTPTQSWAENDIEGIMNSEASYDEKDLAGPVTLAVASENDSTGARVVVVGDSDFATDYYISAYGNRDMAINIVDWAAANENLISLTTAETTSRVLVPPTKATQIAFVIAGLVGFPLLIAATGIIIGIRRKRSG
jgi:ABC-type uncharacterized transport system involved in gliding motility auxiliary subunit